VGTPSDGAAAVGFRPTGYLWGYEGGKSVIHAVDFDGTITLEDKWPGCGKVNEEVVAAMRQARAMGDTIIINTCREGEPLERAIEFLKANGIPYDFINENDPRRQAQYGGDCRKISADCYVDDKSRHPDEWVREIRARAAVFHVK
jgi:hypothetical protein